MRRTALAALGWAITAFACAVSAATGDRASDFPEPRVRESFRALPAPTYRDALDRWRTPEDVNAWIGASFEYDPARALLLSETQRTAGRSHSIHTPEQFCAVARAGAAPTRSARRAARTSADRSTPQPP